MQKKIKKKIRGGKNLPILSQDLSPVELPTLAAGFVHEIKNPLAAIHLHLQLLQNQIEEVKEEKIKIKLKDKVSLIQDEIKNLRYTLENLFVMFESEQKKLERTEGSFDAIILQIIRLLEPQFSRAGVKVIFQPSHIPCPPHLDPIFIRQIILNLILNALQAYEHQNEINKGYVLAEQSIQIGVSEIAAELILTVKDGGPGIPKEIQEKIFDPFYTTKSNGGGGLGLTLVQKMVVLMNGRIKIESWEGKGTAFIIILPKFPEKYLLVEHSQKEKTGA